MTKRFASLCCTWTCLEVLDDNRFALVSYMTNLHHDLSKLTLLLINLFQIAKIEPSHGACSVQMVAQLLVLRVCYYKVALPNRSSTSNANIRSIRSSSCFTSSLPCDTMKLAG
ncbi:hypothetical protein PoB_006262700 [Plakobranchus ocellatus]|uniref:Uncharacterized protein n=1 Tax=Plakobranchus ocellatus TaxID=259542 RepID=A0AAV4CW38_9GAST|nr:hypothetical protein PoB_006262700 [Plakobranchus ocellatus]